MFIMNGIAYAGEPRKNIIITYVKPLDDMMMLVTFSTGEKRLYDASQLLSMQAFQPLKDPAIYHAPVLDHGVLTWDEGAIDIAPETVYQNSHAYEEVISY
jgi:hypothetical protein